MFFGVQFFKLRHLLLPGLVMTSATLAQAAGPASNPADSTTQKKVQIAQNYGKLPLSFEANQGQTDKSVRFLSRGNGYSLFLTDFAAVLSLTKRTPAGGVAAMKGGLDRRMDGSRKAGASASEEKTDVIRMELAGASPKMHVAGDDQLPGTANYFIGNDPAKWHSNVPTYAKVRYSSVYPGVDLVYYGNQRQLEYDFILAPRANPKAIRLHFAGAHKIEITPKGDLQIATENGEIAFQKPVLYQENHGQRQMVVGGFTLEANNSVSFAAGVYDHSRELVIDPTLSYSTYLGGNSGAFIEAIAVDSSGAVYATGRVANSGLYTSPGAPQSTWNGNEQQNQNDNAFISKLNTAGDALVYETYLGGSGGYDSGADSQEGDIGYAIAVDASDNAYVAGFTDSADFPYTAGAYQTVYRGGGNQVSNGFVTKLNANGTSLVYSTYLGETGVNGAGGDGIEGIAIDNSGDAYLAGGTYSNNFPIIGTPFQNSNRAAPISQANAFVAKLNPAGSSLLFFTYFGGTGNPNYGSNGGDAAEAITLDSAGDIFVAGGADSNDLTMKGASFQTSNAAFDAAEINAFIAELNPTATTLLYSTYLGGEGYPGGLGDLAQGIALGPTSDVYVSGLAYSPDFPVSSNALQRTNQSGIYSCSFIARINTSSNNLVYSTYLCGSTGNFPQGLGNTIAVDSSGDAYVTGSTFSKDFPVTGNAFQSTNYEYSSGAATAFFTELNPTLSGEVYSTYLGGTKGCAFIGASNCYYLAGDMGVSLTLDSSGNAYVAGLARSADFPVTAGAYQTSPTQPFAGAGTSFIAKFNMASSTSLTETGVALTGTPNPQNIGSLVVFTAAVTSKTGTAVPAGTVAFSIDGGASEVETLDGTGHASYSTSSLSTGTHSVLATYSGSATDLVSSGSLTETISAAATPAVSLAPSTLTFASTTVGSTTAAQIVTIKNTGTATLDLTYETLTGTGASSYLISANTCAATLAASATCSVSVEFKPTAAGTLTASLSVADNATGSPQTVALSGTGAAAPTYTVSLSPTALTFASTAVGSTTAAQTVTLTNTGTGAVNLTSETLTGTGASSYLISANTCAATLAANASCSVSIEFKPTAVGMLSAALSIADNATGSPQTVALSGTGAAVAGTLTVTSALSFAATNTGSETAAQQVIVKNTGTTAVSFTGFTYTGANTSSFVQTGINCGASLAAGSACAVAIAFKPQSAGALTATLSIADSATGSPQMVALSGTGIAPGSGTLTVTPASLAFAATNVGVETAVKQVVVKNTGTTPVSFTGFTYTGANASSFVQTDVTCGATLAAEASCAVAIAFKPATSGALTATLNIADSASLSPQTVALTGTGIAPGSGSLTVSPASLTFASTNLGSESAVQQLVVKNTGSTPVTFSGFTYSGVGASSFVQTDITCGSTLAAGSACAVAIAFKPQSSGALAATLNIADSAAGSPQTVALSGTGIAAGSGTLSITPASVAFASTAVGSQSAAKQVIVKNTGTTVVSFSGFTYSGANAGSFVQTDITCGATLAAGSACAVAIVFKPQSTGALTATLSIADSAGGSPQSVGLTGTGD